MGIVLEKTALKYTLLETEQIHYQREVRTVLPGGRSVWGWGSVVSILTK